MFDEDRPNEQNRYDGKPAREHPTEMPSDDEIERARKKDERGLQLAIELLGAEQLEEIVLNKYRQRDEFSPSLSQIAEEQGRKDEWKSLVSSRVQEMTFTRQAAKELDINIVEKDNRPTQ